MKFPHRIHTDVVKMREFGSEYRENAYAHMESVRAALDDIPSEYRTSAVLEIRTWHDHEGCEEYSITISYDRPPTPAEIKTQIEEARNQVSQEIEWLHQRAQDILNEASECGYKVAEDQWPFKAQQPSPLEETETIVLLNGCFWGTEYALRHLGIETKAGYAGGTSNEKPTYYSLDHSGHSEAVRVAFDPSIVSIKDILTIAAEKSAGDPSPPSNPRYRRGVLCENETQAEQVRRFSDSRGYNFDVKVSTLFHEAEPYHQGYYVRTLAP